MTTNKLRLTDLVDLTYLQQLQNSFVAATKITAVIIEPDGTHITEPSNWDGFCKLFLEQEETTRECQSYRCKLVADAGEAGYPRMSRCPHTGMTTASVPIFVDRHYLASWVFTQMRIETFYTNEIDDLVRKTGLTREEVADKLDALPSFSIQEFEQFFTLVETLTRTIAEIGHKNLKLTERDRELRSLTEQMVIRDAVLTKLSQSSREALYISDFHTGEMLMVNHAFCEQSGMEMNDIIGKKCWTILGHEGDAFCPGCPRIQLLSGSEGTGERAIREYYNPKFKLWLRSSHEIITWSNGRAAHMVTQQDVTREREMRERLEKMAFYDSVSGLPNSNKLTENFKYSLKQNDRGERRLICFFLSSLPLVTDVYGSLAEEAIVKTITRWVQEQNLGEHGLYCLQRSEYVLVLRKCSRERARELAEEIYARFSKPWLVEIGGNTFSFMGGISLVLLNPPLFLTAPQELLTIITRMFDEAHKGDGLIIYDEEMDKKNREFNRLRLTFEDCVKRNMRGFSVQFQPIVELSSGTWKGVEALCRWNYPGEGPVSPTVFIPEAEKLGLIMPLSIWVLETSVRTVTDLGLHEKDDFFLSVNVSPRQMMDETFADKVKAVLEVYDYPGRMLNIEITESTEMTFDDFTISVIDELQALGVTLSLDDFGTGYSSFNNLKHLPVHYLKTERAFIEDIESNSYMRYFFYILAEIAHIHNMKLIAEGVETVEQLKIVRSSGANFIQGYYFSKPLTPAQLAEKKDHFFTQDYSFLSLTAETVDIRQWLSGRSAWELSPGLFRLLHKFMGIVLENDMDYSLNSILKLAGEYFEVSRTFVLLREQNGLYSNSYEWTAEGARSYKDKLQNIDIASMTPSLLEVFKQEGMLVASDITKLPEDIHRLLQPADEGAIALMPAWQADTLIGFIGMGSDVFTEWSPDALVLLWTMERTLAGILGKDKLESEARRKESMLDALFRNPQITCFISDLDTNDVLWVPESIKDAVGIEAKDLIGKKCHEVFSGLAEVCPFCLVPELKKNPDAVTESRIIRSNKLDKTLITYDCLLTWHEGKAVHLCYTLALTNNDVVGI